MGEFANIVVTSTVLECRDSASSRNTQFGVGRTPGESEIDLERRLLSVQK